MSHEESDRVSASKADGFPSNDQIIDDVIKSYNDLKLEEEKQVNKVLEGIDDSKNKEDVLGDFERDVPDDQPDVDEDFIDDVLLKDIELSLNAEELQKNKVAASSLKNDGNILFKEKKYDAARKKYTEALKICPLHCKEERAVLFSNRAACKMAQDLKKEAIADCDRAIELNPNYIRALSRRAKLYESDEKLDEALEDYKKILELDPGNYEAKAACMRLPGEINERNEKLKEQMLSSLKELGNKILKPFGLSTNNFQVQKDPNSGGYSINFNQNPK